MDIEQLKNFLILAKLLHFSKAAEEICLSQSSLSKQVDKLEQEFNVKFFDRTTRIVRLTPAGKEFCKYAMNIVDEVDKAKKQMREYTEMEQGSIILGSFPIISHLGLTSLIVDFHKAYPNIELKLREAESKTLLQLGKDREIDAAFIPIGNYTDDDCFFDFYPLIEDNLMLMTCKFHPLGNNHLISLSEASKEKFIFMTRNAFAHDICINACKRAGFEPKIVHESNNWDTISGLVGAGLGISLVTLQVANAISERHNTEFIRLKEKFNVTIALAIPKDVNTVRSVSAFKNFVFDWTKLAQTQRTAGLA
ncbi:LysR family transcriptional regulator [Sporomusa sp. KB1]|jgi:LysR family transcriptional activator of glutamate synthase operon|uniref:LysR family transcriptional regulator n=1 Tax=Sporomusa sp. KB1 TaxID=943346 RepID=UPI0011A3EDF8|nr:LysR family transcriptional regulator [Sporomusa sp. KB1]TWH49275.1 LysR family transcriptional activator of glutamate synthase operon [Sporomusa sp. KB1]